MVESHVLQKKNRYKYVSTFFLLSMSIFSPKTTKKIDPKIKKKNFVCAVAMHNYKILPESEKKIRQKPFSLRNVFFFKQIYPFSPFIYLLKDQGGYVLSKNIPTLLNKSRKGFLL